MVPSEKSASPCRRCQSQPDGVPRFVEDGKESRRASVKILTMLDSMDAAAITALAGELSNTANGWTDPRSGILLQLA